MRPCAPRVPQGSRACRGIGAQTRSPAGERAGGQGGVENGHGQRATPCHAAARAASPVHTYEAGWQRRRREVGWRGGGGGAHLRACLEDIPRATVEDQIEVALAEARLLVHQPIGRLRNHVQARGEDLQRGREDRELAAAVHTRATTLSRTPCGMCGECSAWRVWHVWHAWQQHGTCGECRTRSGIPSAASRA